MAQVESASGRGEVERFHYAKLKVEVSSPIQKAVQGVAKNVVKGQPKATQPLFMGTHHLTKGKDSISALERDVNEFEERSWEEVEIDENGKILLTNKKVQVDPPVQELEEAERFLEEKTGEKRVQKPTEQPWEEGGEFVDVPLTEEVPQTTTEPEQPPAKRAELKKQKSGERIRGTPDSENSIEIRKNILLNRIERKAKEISTRIKSSCVFRGFYPLQKYGVEYCHASDFQVRLLGPVMNKRITINNTPEHVELKGKIGGVDVTRAFFLKILDNDCAIVGRCLP